MAHLSVGDVSNITFHKASIGGYKTEEVDNFIDDVEETMESLVRSKMQLEKDLKALKSENKLLKEQEKSVKDTLLEAKKLAGAAVREARANAEKMEQEAKEKAEKMVSDAEDQLEDQKVKLDDMKKEVSEFRTSLLNMYKEHLKLIDALPKCDNKNQDDNTESQAIKETAEVEKKIVLDESSSLEDIKKMVKQSPKEFLDATLKDYDIELEESEDIEDVEEIEDDEPKKSSFDILAETRTIKFDSLKFGDNYDLASDED